MAFVISFFLTLFFILLALKLKNVFIPPKYIKDLPRIPLLHTLNAIFNQKTQPELVKDLKKTKLGHKDGFRCGWFMGDWIVDVVNPEYIKYILSNSDIFEKKMFFTDKSPLGQLMGRNVAFVNGEPWKRLRKIINPAFKERWDTNVFGNYANQVIAAWNNMLHSPIEVHEWMQRITLDSLGDIGFLYKFNSITKPNNELVKRYNSVMSEGFQIIYLVFPILDKLPHRHSYVKNAAMFRELLLEVVEFRRKEVREKIKNGKEEEIRDIVGMLLRESEAEENPLTDQEVLENVFIFFLAGHDTTANALSVALYFMSVNLDIQDRVFEEVEGVIGDKPLDYIPNHEDIKHLDYLSLVIKECLRIYPSATALNVRKCTQDVTIGGRHFPEGTEFALNIMNLHYNEDYYDDPNSFVPERFSKEGSDKEVPSSYLPFGGGSRICIGQSFSLTEQKVVLAMLVRNFMFELPKSSPHCEEMHFKTGGLLHPLDLELVITRRREE